MTVTDQTVFPPADASTDLAAKLRALTARLHDSDSAMTVITVEVEGERLIVPDILLPLITEAIDSLAEGKAVRVEPGDLVLSTQEAADLLGVSRPTLVRILDAGTIPFSTPAGTHRRVKRADVLAYQEQSTRRRREGLDRLLTAPDATGDPEAVVNFGPRR